MARCVNYETGETCPHFYKCEKQGEEVLVTVSKFKKLA